MGRTKTSLIMVAHPIWRPQLFAATIIIRSVPDGFDTASWFDPNILPTEGTMVEDGFHGYVEAEGGDHRFWLPEGDQIVRAAVIIPLDPYYPERRQSAERFHRWLTGGPSGPWPRWQCFSRYQIHRFSLMLRAWDGADAGASRQEIAGLLLNPDVGTLRSIDWKNRPERRRLHRLLKAAQDLIDGGYLRLLRPAARSGRARRTR